MNLNKLLPFFMSKGRILCSTFSTTVVPKEEMIKVGNIKINYVKVGNGPHHVLCFPGALGSIWTDFKPQVDNFDREKFTLIVWEPPGYGKSRPPQKSFPVDYYEKDAWFAGEFMKALNIPKYSLLGWSDGGVSSMILASRQPDPLQKLVIWGTHSFILPQELETYKKVKNIKTWSQKMREAMIEMYGEELFAKYWADWVDGAATITKLKNGNICSDMLKDIKCPTYILYGENDPMVDKMHASHLRSNIPRSKLKLYPKGKHNIHLRFAEDFNNTVQEFLLES